MKIAKTLLAIALPLTLSAACAMDVGSSSDALTADINGDFGINACGQSTANWIGDAEWPVDTIVAGNMEFTKSELVDYIQQNPGARSALIAEIAAGQLNITAGLEIPDGVIEELVAADNLVMADEDGTTPPPVNIDEFGNLADFNQFADLDCFIAGGQVAQETIQTVDTRDDIVQPVPGSPDLRADLFVDE